MKGHKPLAQQKEDLMKKKAEEVDVKIFKIPEEIYEDFQDINDQNEQMFEFVSYQLVSNFLERICLKIKPAGTESLEKTEEKESVPKGEVSGDSTKESSKDNDEEMKDIEKKEDD